MKRSPTLRGWGRLSNEGHGFSRAARSLCASFINTTQNSLPFGQQPINRSNLILLGQALFKAINKLHRQKAS
jgi:hypothetical protein